MRFRPTILVLDNGANGRRQRMWRKSITRAIRRQSKKMAVPVEVVPRREIHRFFHSGGRTNKYDRAALVASWFPMLTRALPRQPKFYDPEPYAMTAIDAVILGAAYLKRQNIGADSTRTT